LAQVLGACAFCHILSCSVAMATIGTPGESCRALQFGSLLEQRDEDHPLHWLQPTPEMSAPSPLHLPHCRPLTSKPLDRASWLHECSSETSTLEGESADASPERCSEDGSCRGDEARDVWFVPSVPPQLTPRVSSCSSPPSPPATTPSELPNCSFPWETPSPMAAFAMCAALHIARASLHANGLVPSLVEAAEGFSALGAWSEAQEEGYGGFIGAMQAETVQPASWAGLSSVGSAGHEVGKCKPCAFVHRPMGCTDGAACSYCHLCEPGEKKRRQRQKFEAARQRRLSRKATGAGDLKAVGTRIVQQQQQEQQNHNFCGQVTSAELTEAMTGRIAAAALPKRSFGSVQHQQLPHVFGELLGVALADERISAALPALGTAPVAPISGWVAAPR